MYGCLQNAEYKISDNVEKILNDEIAMGLMNKNIYENFQIKADKIRYIRSILLNAKYDKKVVAGMVQLQKYSNELCWYKAGYD